MAFSCILVGLDASSTCARDGSFLSPRANDSCPKTSDVIALFTELLMTKHCGLALPYLDLQYKSRRSSYYNEPLCTGQEGNHRSYTQGSLEAVGWCGERARGLDKSSYRCNWTISSCWHPAKPLQGTETEITATPALVKHQQLQGSLPT